MEEANYTSPGHDDFTFYHLDDTDNANAYYYTTYVYNLNLLYQFILNLYRDIFFEEDWFYKQDEYRVRLINPTLNVDNRKLDIFFYFIHQFTLNLKFEEETRPSYKWKDLLKGKRFYERLNKLYIPDCLVWNYAKVRWNSYSIYRKNRIVIVNQIGKVSKLCPSNPIFLMICQSLDNIKLMKDYETDRQQENNILTVYNDKNNKCREKLIHDINVQFGNKTDEKEIDQMVTAYAQCRIYAYMIFNLLTEIKSKYLKYLDKYCSNELNDKTVELLLQRTIKSPDIASFAKTEEDTDDNYWQHLEQRSWQEKNLGESSFYGLFPGQETRDKSAIKSINACSPNMLLCNVLFDGMSVYAKKTFYPGDIIEICPTKPISKSSLYSKDVRDISFEVIKNEKFVIPFGYCQYYDIPVDGSETNCFYEWVDSNNTIKIIANKKIPKGTILILDVEDSSNQ